MEKERVPTDSVPSVPRAEAERLKAVIDAMGDGLVLHDMDGEITGINPALEKMIGYEKSELIGKNVLDLMPRMVKPEDLEKVRKVIRTALDGKVPPPIPFTLIKKGGREIPTTFTTSFIKDSGGNPISTIMVLKDITGLRRAMGERLKAVTDKWWVEELAKFAKVVVGRESKMVELKKRIKELESKLKGITGKG